MKARITRIALVCAVAIAMPGIGMAQTYEPCTAAGNIADGGLGTTIVNIPYTTGTSVYAKTTSSPFTVDISAHILSTYPAWAGPIGQAVSSWNQILSTAYHATIHFHADDESGWTVPSGCLATGSPVDDFPTPFTTRPGVSAFATTYYNGPLACFMSGGVVASGSFSDINVIIKHNPTYNWNTNISNSVPCPTNQYDLVTACMQAIGHGVGLLSEIDATGTRYAHTTQWPNVFEHFIDDNGTGKTTGAITYMKDLVGASLPFLSGFITGAGNYSVDIPSDKTFSSSCYFRGTTAPLTQLYIPGSPGFYQPGVNLNYIIPTSTDLMSFGLPTGRKVHAPSPTEIKMLNDIGWNATTGSLGFVDNLTLSPDPGVLDVGVSSNFTAGLGSGFTPPAATLTWSLSLVANDGIIPISSGSGVNPWSATISLPAGHTWLRDINGRIQGMLSVSSSYSMGGSIAPASIDIGVNTAPDKPLLTITNIQDESCCGTKQLQFYSAGSDYFYVLSRENMGGVWDTWSVNIPTPGDQSYTFTGLDETIPHEFYVEAFNATGSATSNTIYNGACKANITASPNPLTHAATVHIDAGYHGFLINNVTITNSQTGATVATIPFDGVSSSVDISLSPYGLTTGVYVLNVSCATRFDPASCYTLGGMVSLEVTD